ncbi:MAG: dethiobiotin synthase [Odoribacter sp.]|nr:dethiobiotin synthase [Odoribacter sp.]
MKNLLKMSVYFISGIDTDAGKSIATGVIAATLQNQGRKVITQKFIQTGCREISEDIQKHREIMGIPLQEVDLDRTTCPYIMSYPASPHLAAEIDGITVDKDLIHHATEKLSRQYDIVLLEGAGGLYVPVNRHYLTIDYISEYGYPLILVTSSKLGSINHTLMSLELCRIRGIRVSHVIYNDFPDNSEFIKADSIRVIGEYLKNYFPDTPLIELPVIEKNTCPRLDIKL